MNERILNKYYNIGNFNHPSRIGYMMKMIRELKPLTQDEWRLWYYKNIHDEQYVKDIASEIAFIEIDASIMSTIIVIISATSVIPFEFFIIILLILSLSIYLILPNYNLNVNSFLLF